MIETLGFLTQVMTGTTVLALLWLSLRAWRERPAWGLGVLLLSPLTATLFGISHWKREKLPFLAYLASFTVLLALLVSLFSAWGGWELVKASRQARQALEMHTVTQADADALRRARLTFHSRSGIDYDDNGLLAHLQQAIERSAMAEQVAMPAGGKGSAEEELPESYTLEDLYRRAPKNRNRYRLVFRTINIGDAGKFVGYTVKVTRRNVPEREYRLTGAYGDKLQFTQRKDKGTYTFAYRRSDIEKMRVLTRVDY